MDDFEDMLKKAMEAEQHEDNEDDMEDLAGGFVGILSMGKMLQLGKAANDKQDEVLAKLTKDLQEYSKMNTLSYHAHATMAVQRAADEIKILSAIISACAISGVDSITKKSEDMKDTLNTILKINMLR